MLNENFLLLILLLVGATQIHGTEKVSDIKGRLLTPQEGCGISNDPNYRNVTDGRAKNGAWPWLVLLGYREKSENKDDEKAYNIENDDEEFNEYPWRYRYRFPCGGSLITSRHVLSSARCFKSNKINIARLGEYDMTETRDGRHINVAISHVDKRKSHSSMLIFAEHDLALVHLKRDIAFNDRIRPICLPVNWRVDSQQIMNPELYVAGWGHRNWCDRMGEKEWTVYLHQLKVPLIENGECKEKYHNLYPDQKIPDFRFDENEVYCGGSFDGCKEDCHDFMGAPLMFPSTIEGETIFYQVGVWESEHTCKNPSHLGVFTSTNVQAQLDWIKEKLL